MKELRGKVAVVTGAASGIGKALARRWAREGMAVVLADWDAQARITDGDYDGAVQAEQLAQAARKQADELATRATKRPASRP